MIPTKEQSSIYLGPAAEAEKFKVKAMLLAFMSENLHSSQIIQLDLSKTDEYDFTDDMAIEKTLKKHGLFGPQFGYSAFKPFLTERLQKTGTYYDQSKSNANIMWCCFISPENPHRIVAEETSLLDYIEQLSNKNHDHGTFAIYDLNYLEVVDMDDNEFQFKDPTQKKAALRAIVHVKLR